MMAVVILIDSNFDRCDLMNAMVPLTTPLRSQRYV